jgi:hypothetical protein
MFVLSRPWDSTKNYVDFVFIVKIGHRTAMFVLYYKIRTRMSRRTVEVKAIIFNMQTSRKNVKRIRNIDRFVPVLLRWQ